MRKLVLEQTPHYLLKKTHGQENLFKEKLC